jgi:hypothetical protein
MKPSLVKRVLTILPHVISLLLRWQLGCVELGTTEIGAESLVTRGFEEFTAAIKTALPHRQSFFPHEKAEQVPADKVQGVSGSFLHQF